MQDHHQDFQQQGEHLLDLHGLFLVTRRGRKKVKTEVQEVFAFPEHALPPVSFLPLLSFGLVNLENLQILRVPGSAKISRSSCQMVIMVAF